MVHGMMDSLILFVLSFFFCIPFVFVGFLFGRFYGLPAEDLGILIMGAWLGTNLVMSSSWRLYVFERFNRLSEKAYFKSGCGRPSFIDFMRALLEKPIKVNKDLPYPASGNNGCRPVGGSEDWDLIIDEESDHD
jgi:hypothetical protein